MTLHGAAEGLGVPHRLEWFGPMLQDGGVEAVEDQKCWMRQ